MKKTLLATAATTAIVVGGLSVAQVASAQTDDSGATETTTVEVVDTSTDERRSGERRGHRGGGCDLDTAAETIGIEVEDLRSALESGQSIAEVATDNGVEPDIVVEAMVAETAEHLSEKVESGRVTQDEADERLADKTERITTRVFETDADTETDTDGEADVEDDTGTRPEEGEGS